MVDLHPDRAATVKHDPESQRRVQQREIGAVQNGLQKRAGAAAAQTVALSDLIDANACLHGAVEIRGGGMSCLLGGG